MTWYEIQKYWSINTTRTVNVTASCTVYKWVQCGPVVLLTHYDKKIKGV